MLENGFIMPETGLRGNFYCRNTSNYRRVRLFVVMRFVTKKTIVIIDVYVFTRMWELRRKENRRYWSCVRLWDYVYQLACSL